MFDTLAIDDFATNIYFFTTYMYTAITRVITYTNVGMLFMGRLGKLSQTFHWDTIFIFKEIHLASRLS